MSPASSTSLFEQGEWTIFCFEFLSFSFAVCFIFNMVWQRLDYPTFLICSTMFSFCERLVLHPSLKVLTLCWSASAKPGEDGAGQVHWPSVHSQSQGLSLRTALCVLWGFTRAKWLCLHMSGEMFVQWKFKYQLLRRVLPWNTRVIILWQCLFWSKYNIKNLLQMRQARTLQIYLRKGLINSLVWLFSVHHIGQAWMYLTVLDLTLNMFDWKNLTMPKTWLFTFSS